MFTRYLRLWERHLILLSVSKKNKIPTSLRVFGFPAGTVVKNLPASAGSSRAAGSIPGSGRSPGVGNGNPLQYSCLEISMAEETGGLQSVGPQRAGCDSTVLFCSLSEIMQRTYRTVYLTNNYWVSLWATTVKQIDNFGVRGVHIEENQINMIFNQKRQKKFHIYTCIYNKFPRFNSPFSCKVPSFK